MRTSFSRAALAASVVLTACTSRPAADAGGSTARRDTAGSAPAAATGEDSAQIGRLAAQVARHALRIGRGDVVMIVGGLHTIPAMEAFALETARAGGLQNMLLLSERVTRTALREVPEENFALPATYFADWLRSTTVYIGLPSEADPKATYADIPEAKLAKWNARFQSTFDMLNNARVRGAYIDYPSPGAAAAVGMDPAAYARMQLAAIAADAGAMTKACRALEERFRRGRTVRITSPAGTDLRITLAGRPGIVDAGMLAPGAEREKLFAKRWTVLPAGSFGVAPGETSAQGVVVTPRDMCKFAPVREARYEFSGGTLGSVTAGQGEACLNEVLKSYGQGIRRVGSFSIGLNPELKVVEEGGDYRPWNAAGLVSVWLGDNTLMGGSNKVEGAVGMGLPIPNATLELDGQVLVRDGKLVAGEGAVAGR
jgi:leucyl aminopeptidase (aminopeptidase T)